MPKPQFDLEGDVLTEVERKAEKPPLYRVLLHNDDYTTMDFVVFILRTVFRRTEEEAVRIILHVHQRGVGVAGVYTREIAETKASKTIRLARERDFPLLCTIEEE